MGVSGIGFSGTGSEGAYLVPKNGGEPSNS